MASFSSSIPRQGAGAGRIEPSGYFDSERTGWGKCARNSAERFKLNALLQQSLGIYLSGKG